MDKLVFVVTTNQHGSYGYLATRIANFLRNYGIQSEIVYEAQNKPSMNFSSSRVVVYATFQGSQLLMKLHKFPKENTVFFNDTALITLNLKWVCDRLNEGWKIYSSSRFDADLIRSYCDIDYVPHFIPIQPSKGKSYEDRFTDFITVGINEQDFDRKGHYWNAIARILGFNAISICRMLCYGEHFEEVPDEDLFKLYARTKYYLGMNHAETPHLPLIEAFAFSTPALLLNAHEFTYFVKDLELPYVKPSFVSIRGRKNFFFYEVDPYDFIKKIAEVMRKGKPYWEGLSQKVREYYTKHFYLKNRLEEFSEITGVRIGEKA